MLVQGITNLVSKTYHLKEDGNILSDNPNFGPDVLPGTYSIGHRNPQGSVLHLDHSDSLIHRVLTSWWQRA